MGGREGLAGSRAMQQQLLAGAPVQMEAPAAAAAALLKERPAACQGLVVLSYPEACYPRRHAFSY